MYKGLLLWPYVIGSMFVAIFCLMGLRATVFVDGHVPGAVVVVVFSLTCLLGVVAFRLGEPMIMRRMLRNAIRHNRASGGVVVKTSPRSVVTVANALIPIPSGHRARSARTDVAGAASQRLVVVAARGKVLLVTSRSRTFVELTEGSFRVADVGGRGAIEVRLAGHHAAVFEAFAPTRWGFERMSAPAVERALARDSASWSAGETT